MKSTHLIFRHQSCLLLLQRLNDDRYIMDTVFRWSLQGWTVSLVQGLGLSADCSNWGGLSSWEKRLRRRLWWAVYVADKWSFVSAGLSSHIKNEDFDVMPLTIRDFESVKQDNEAILASEHRTTDAPDSPPQSHFYHLV